MEGGAETEGERGPGGSVPADGRRQDAWDSNSRAEPKP